MLIVSFNIEFNNNRSGKVWILHLESVHGTSLARTINFPIVLHLFASKAEDLVVDSLQLFVGKDSLKRELNVLSKAIS